MARRSSAGARARREQKEAAKPIDPHADLKIFLQNIKVIELKRTMIKKAGGRIPIIWIFVVLTGFLFLGAIVGLSLIGGFILGTLFFGVLAQLYGPTGAISRRTQARKEISRLRDQSIALLPAINDKKIVRIFPISRITKAGLSIAGHGQNVTQDTFQTMSGDGVFNMAVYSHLGVGFVGANSGVEISDPLLNDQLWRAKARLLRTPDAAVSEAISKLR